MSPQRQPSNAASTIVATTLVVIMLALGSAFGYYLLGGKQKPADAETPTPSIETCLVCVSGSGSGGNNIPAPFPASNQGSGGNTQR